MSFARVAAAVRAKGTPVWEPEGWLNVKGVGSYTPVGIMVHHTAMSVPLSVAAAQYANRFNGPLCNFVVMSLPRQVNCISGGYSYDSGLGSGKVLAEVKAGVPPPATALARNLTDDTNGNPWFIDIEVDHRGDGSPITPAAREGLLDLLVVLCQEFSIRPVQIIGHEEWTRRKVDPHFQFEPAEIRLEVAKRLGTNPPLNPPVVVTEPLPVGLVELAARPSVTVRQMQAWAKTKSATRRFIQLAPVFFREALALGIDPAVPYAISYHETAGGHFGGVVYPSMHNWGGLKTASGGSNTDVAAHAAFPSDEVGVRAVVQHVANYAGIDVLPEERVDPRWNDALLGTAEQLPSSGWQWSSTPAQHADRVVLNVGGMRSAS